MKRFKSGFIAALILLAALGAKAQKTGAEYFAGKWEVLVKGTPNGDAKMIFQLDKKTDSLTGVAQDTTGKEISKFTQVELKGNELTVYFNTQGYDVNVTLAKKDEDFATGSLMGMFETEAKRMKATKLKD